MSTLSSKNVFPSTGSFLIRRVPALPKLRVPEEQIPFTETTSPSFGERFEISSIVKYFLCSSRFSTAPNGPLGAMSL